RAGTRGARCAQHVLDGWLRHRPGAVHPAADDRLLPAGFTRRAGGLDARPRHRQLLQDLPCLRRRRPRGQPHPSQHRRQHRAVLDRGAGCVPLAALAKEKVMSTTVDTTSDIRIFRIDIADEQIDDLRRRIAATRWPSKELVEDRSQGVQLATTKELARYWTED